MNYRERFKAAMRHERVDRPPMDLAGTSLNAIEDEHSVRLLAECLGFHEPYDGWYKKFDERILKRLDIDFRRAGDILSPASPLARNISAVRRVDCWGVERAYTGRYWDIVDPPLRGAETEDLENYPWPKASDIDKTQIAEIARQAKHLYEETDYVICGEHPVFGVFELGCWMCGFDDFLLKMALDPQFVFAFFDKVLHYQKEVIELYYGAIGRYIHLTTSGDDFGMQTGPFFSTRMFAEMIIPYYAERIRYTKQFTDAYYLHHTCGAVFPLIPDLIGAGADILNPIQPGAKDMEPDKLKRAYGDRIVFHGGIDTQHLLPEGTPEEVAAGVRGVLDAMGPDGGYILSAAHNIQSDVPPENIAAIFIEGKRLQRN